MALKSYDPCPGGSNQKIKFCGCGKDLLTELNDMLDAISGGQRAGALSRANRLLETKGNRACLLAVKAMCQYTMDADEALAETAETFLREHPENPVALALSAIRAARKRDHRSAIDELQKAILHIDHDIHEMVHAAMEEVGLALLQAGYPLAARSYLAMHEGLAGDIENRPDSTLMRFFHSTDVPLILKMSQLLKQPPADAPYKQEFQRAVEENDLGHWQSAMEQFAVLAEQYPDVPDLAFNAAIVCDRLAYEQKSVKWRHRFAAGKDVDLEEAIAQEALAQFMDDELNITTPELTQTYVIADADRVTEKLISASHIESMEFDPSQLEDNDTPPPRGVFMLLDRELPEDTSDLTFDKVPEVLGEILVYGKETDRDARVCFVFAKSSDADQKIAAFEDLLGELIGEMAEEKETGELPWESVELGWRWRLPDDMPPAQRVELLQAKRRDVNLNTWPATPLPTLDGKTPSDAAADPAYHVRILGRILLMELNAESMNFDFDANELREKLGLPRVDDLPASDDLDVNELSILVLHRLPAEDLNDTQLINAYTNANAMRAARAIRRMAKEMVQRDSIVDAKGRVDLYSQLSSLAGNLDESLDYIKKAQEEAAKAKISPARLLLQEVQLHFARGEGEDAGEVIQTLQTNHADEPGVSEALFRMFLELGIINPDGSPRMQGQEAAHGPSVATEDAAPAAEGGLWTPDQGPAGEASKPKSDLWIPD